MAYFYLCYLSFNTFLNIFGAKMLFFPYTNECWVNYSPLNNYYIVLSHNYNNLKKLTELHYLNYLKAAI